MSDDNEVVEKLALSLSKQAVKHGLISVELSPKLAKFVADQIFFTIDLLKKSAGEGGLKRKDIIFFVISKIKSTADLAASERFECIIASGALLVSLVKFLTIGRSNPMTLVHEAVSLLAECYQTDKTCGASSAIYKRIERSALPMYMWLDEGVKGLLLRGAYY